MKKIFYTILLIGIYSSSVFKSFATHVTGGEITYSCTSTPGTWQITLTVYADCSGTPMCSGNCNQSCSTTVSVSSVSTNTTHSTLSLFLISVSDVDPNPLCPSSKSICTNRSCVTAGTFTPGMEKYIFQGNVNLGSTSGIPSSDCNIRIGYNGCCRSSSINTGQAGNNFFLEAIINRCASASPCNASPVLTNDPVMIICGGQPFIYNMGAFDPDGDSLSFSFTPSLQSVGVSATYTAPYSYDKPMPYTGGGYLFPLGISCDPSNGDIMFTSPYAGSGYFIGVVAVKIMQWKKIGGVTTLMGTTTRDNQMNLMQCTPNNPPRLLTNPPNPLNANQPKTYWNVCAGNTLCFNVIGKDTDFYPSNTPPISDTTYLEWNNSLASKGATFLPTYTIASRKINGPREDVYQFCWTPDSTVISNNPYFFTVKAKDSRCPNAGKATRAIYIKVTGTGSATINKIYQPCYKWNFSYSSPHPEYIASQQWQISNTSGVFNNYNFSWFPTNSVSYFSFNDTGKFVVKLILTSQSSGCTTTIFDTVYNPVAFRLYNLPDTTVCSGTTIKLKANHYGGISPITFHWFDTTNSVTVLSSNDSLIISPTSLKNYKFIINDSVGCFLSDISTVNVNPLPISTLPAFARICKGTVDTLDPGNNNGNIKSYLWNTGDSTQTIIRNDSNLFWVQLTDLNGCSFQDTFLLFVNQLPSVNAGNDVAICAGQSTTLQAVGAQNYNWFEMPSTNVIGNNSSLNVTPISKTTYKVFGTETIYGVSCNNSDTVKVIVNPKPALPAIAGASSVNVNQVNSYSVANHVSSSYNWFLNNGFIGSGQGTNSANVTFTTAGSGKINVIESQNNCSSDTASKIVTVNVVIGMNEKNIFRNLNIFPNPTTGLLNIEFETSENNIELEVFDVIGKSVLKNNFQHIGGLFQHSINMTHLNHGIYFVKIFAGEKSTTVKVSVK